MATEEESVSSLAALSFSSVLQFKHHATQEVSSWVVDFYSEWELHLHLQQGQHTLSNWHIQLTEEQWLECTTTFGGLETSLQVGPVSEFLTSHGSIRS